MDRRFEESALQLDALRLVKTEAKHSERERLRRDTSKRQRKASDSYTRSTKLLPLLETHLEKCIRQLESIMENNIERDSEQLLIRSTCMPFNMDFIKARPHQFKVLPSGYLKVRTSDTRESSAGEYYGCGGELWQFHCILHD